MWLMGASSPVPGGVESSLPVQSLLTQRACCGSGTAQCWGFLFMFYVCSWQFLRGWGTLAWSLPHLLSCQEHPEYPGLLVMTLGSRRAETLPTPPGEALNGSQCLFSELLLFCSLHEVESRSSQCGLKGHFAVCKPIGKDKRVLGVGGLLRQAPLPSNPRSTKESLLPSGSRQRASQAACCACLQTGPFDILAELSVLC